MFLVIMQQCEHAESHLETAVEHVKVTVATNHLYEHDTHTMRH